MVVSHPHVIDGQSVDVQISPPKELTMFVGDLSPATTSERLRSYFSRFGKLLLADVKQDKLTGESRCFGYITFSSQEEVI
jgi:RNA recognition motif-containing protein